MNLSVPLPPHLEQFVREQLASGLFQSESEVFQAALKLLEDQCLSHGPSPARLKQDPDRRPTRKALEPASKVFWEGMREQLHAEGMPGNEAGRLPSERRSPRGILADIRSHISPDDIKEARREMWSGFLSGEA